MSLYTFTLQNLTTHEPRLLTVQETSFESARFEAFRIAFREWDWRRVGVIEWTVVGEERSA